MYKLTFTNYTETDTVMYFDEYSDAVNAIGTLQVKMGGNNSADFDYEIERDDGKIELTTFGLDFLFG